MDNSRSKKWIVLFILVLAILGVLGFLFVKDELVEPTPIIEEPVEVVVSKKVIGRSVQGRPIEAVTFRPSGQTNGEGEVHLLFVGGIHGGYEWNTVVLANQFIDYLEANPTALPEGLSVTVIPSANPDGLYKIIGKEGRFSLADASAVTVDTAPGRFNARGVDLNRNFDCKWQPESTWRGEVVSAGATPFSEPEAVAIRDFVMANDPQAVIFWHSQGNAVYASECEVGILPETLAIMNEYSSASGYAPFESFDAYPITGDAEGWLASIGVPALTVELSTHETIEWEKNLAGINELLEYYSN